LVNTFGDEEDVDSIVYKYSSRKERLLKLSRNYTNCEAYKQINLDLTKSGEYAILRKWAFDGLLYFTTVKTKEDAHGIIHNDYFEENKGRNTHIVACYVVIKLSDLKLFPTQQELRCLDKRNKFWVTWLIDLDDLEELKLN
jgi:hypothetical protein